MSSMNPLSAGHGYMKWIHNLEQDVWTDVWLRLYDDHHHVRSDLRWRDLNIASVYRATGGRVVEGTLANIV